MTYTSAEPSSHLKAKLLYQLMHGSITCTKSIHIYIILKKNYLINEIIEHVKFILLLYLMLNCLISNFFNLVFAIMKTICIIVNSISNSSFIQTENESTMKNEIILEGFENFVSDVLTYGEMRNVRGGDTYTSASANTYYGRNGDCNRSCDISGAGGSRPCSPPQYSQSTGAFC